MSDIRTRVHGRPLFAVLGALLALVVVLFVPGEALAAGSTSSGASGSGDFLGIAQGLGDQGAAIARIIGALLLIGTIFFGWVQNSMKIVGIGIVMAIIASFAASGQLWKAGQSTAAGISGGQVQTRP